jgi:hypothetical protein
MTPLDSFDQAVSEYFVQLPAMEGVQPYHGENYRNLFSNLRKAFLSGNLNEFMDIRASWTRYVIDVCHEQPAADSKIEDAVYRMRDELRKL